MNPEEFHKLLGALEEARSYGSSTEAPPSREPYKLSDDGTAHVVFRGTVWADAPDWIAGWMDVADPRALVATLDTAARDPSVSSVVIHMDSPGGFLTGVPEAAQALKEFDKPSKVIVDGQCCSAAYWIASGAGEILADGETTTIGSIGVYCTLLDMHKLYADAGLEVKLVSSGGIKGHGTSGLQVSEALLSSMQARVDKICEMFCAAISAHRGEDLRDLATGETWMTQDAIANGLIDGMLSRKGAAMPATKGEGITAAAELAALKEKYDKLLATQQGQQRAGMLDTAVREGRLMPAQREAMLRLAERIPLEALEEFIQACPTTLRAEPIGASVEEPQGSDDPEGTFLERIRTNVHNGLTWEQAMDKAAAEHPQGLAEYRDAVRGGR